MRWLAGTTVPAVALIAGIITQSRIKSGTTS
jgi:hypothetical protein